MAGKRIAVAAIMAVALLAASQPALAGVGGCKPIAGVGGCGGWLITSQEMDSQTPSILDYSQGAIPAQFHAFLKAMLGDRTGGTQEEGELLAAPEDLTTAGCRPLPGVGGCAL